MLYYSCDRPDGKGGWDIWYSIYNPKKKEYKKPKSVGYKINTTGNEITPFYDIENRKMFFSSDGHPGLGAYDIFRTESEIREWTPPKNIGIPVNSNVDDIYYVYGEDPGSVFFVSNRETELKHSISTCCYDILSFKNIEYRYIAMEGTVNKVELTLANNNSVKKKKDPIQNAVVTLYKKDVAKDKYIFIKKEVLLEFV